EQRGHPLAEPVVVDLDDVPAEPGGRQVAPLGRRRRRLDRAEQVAEHGRRVEAGLGGCLAEAALTATAVVEPRTLEHRGVALVAGDELGEGGGEVDHRDSSGGEVLVRDPRRRGAARGTDSERTWRRQRAWRGSRGWS